MRELSKILLSAFSTEELEALADAAVRELSQRKAAFTTAAELEGLSNRAANALQRAEVNSVAEILRLGRGGLLRLPGMGMNSFGEISAALSKMGHELRS